MVQQDSPARAIIKHVDGIGNSDKDDVVERSTNCTVDESMTRNRTAEQIQNTPFSCFFLFLNYMIGVGILNQPYVFLKCGILGAFILYIFASYFTWLGLMLITESAHFANIYEYQKLSSSAYGKFGDLLVDVSVLIYAFGAELGYFLIIGNTMSDLLVSWGCQSTICQPYVVITFMMFVFMLPLCLFRHFGHFQFLSIFSIFCITLCIFLVVIGGPIVRNTYTDDSVNDSVVVINGMGMLTSVGSLVFSLSCAPATLQIYIAGNREAQMPKIWLLTTLNAVLVGTLMLVVMGTAGYLSFRGTTDGNILGKICKVNTIYY